MKHSLYLFIVLFSSLQLAAQKNADARFPGRSAFFAELGGPGVLFSANIDHRFTPSRLGWGGRVGIGFFQSGDDYYDPALGYSVYRDRSVITVPLQVNYIFGKGNSPHTFEAGVGFTVLSRPVHVFDSYNNETSSILGTAAFMYRRQPVGGGFTWRIGLTPVLQRGFVQLSAAAGVGYCF